MIKESESRKAATFTRLNEFLSDQDHEKLTKRDIRWLKKATNMANENPNKNFKLGAVIVQANKIIGSGINSRKTHPLQSKWNDKSDCLHAEVAAILDAGNKEFSKPKSTIYVARISKGKKTPACSYPCVNCWAMLDYIGIRNIVCYNEDGKAVKIKVKD